MISVTDFIAGLQVSPDDKEMIAALATSLEGQGVDLSGVFNLRAATVATLEQVAPTSYQYRVVILARLPEGAAKGSKRKVAEREEILNEYVTSDEDDAHRSFNTFSEFVKTATVPTRVELQRQAVTVAEWETIVESGNW